MYGDGARPRSVSLLVRGVLALVLGAAALLSPLLPTAALPGLFGLYMLADGIVALGAARVEGERSLQMLEALVGLFLGAATLARSGATRWSLVAWVAAFAAVRGLLQILQSARARPHDGLLALAGALSLATGIAAILAPAAVGALLLLLGAYAIAFGLVVTAIGVRDEPAQRRTAT
jgi:uncharacterized membrane protein HdeD (DUF308 family)